MHCCAITSDCVFDHAFPILQNGIAVPGRNVYMRGVTQLTPKLDVAQAVLKRIAELGVSDPDVQVGMLFEYFSLAKVNSVAHDATAFRSRGPKGNVLAQVAWANDTPEKSKRGRDIAHELTGIITAKEREAHEYENSGYGNYGRCRRIVRRAAWLTTRASLEGEEKVSPEKTHKLFGDNYPKLQQIKKKYDPEMLFAKWFVIQPAP